jgi:hypothetical protein
MRTPRSSFFEGEGKLIFALFWLIGAFCLAGLLWVWIGSDRAKPVMLDLTTGKPVPTRTPGR